MRLEVFLGAFIALADLSGTAHADLLGTPAPRFSAADTQIIRRNELLRAIVESDPWLVRRMLDLMLQRRSGASGTGAAPPQGLDPVKDPDLTRASRTAEGSVEWLELLKQARIEKESREKDVGATGNRSAEGSVELIEMMKRAKAEKESKSAR